jgi:glycosyltransferase involved in cell wall biosynthesis
MPVGKKRNILISMSKGKFIAFVDDDDRVNSNYIKIITDIIKTNPDIDCIGMTGIYTTDGQDPKKFIHTLKCKEYYEKDGIYYRCPNHLNPIRRDCIKDIKFDEINFGEDAKWAFKIRDKNLLKKEIMYDKDPLYYYRFSRSVTATQ